MLAFDRSVLEAWKREVEPQLYERLARYGAVMVLLGGASTPGFDTAAATPSSPPLEVGEPEPAAGPAEGARMVSWAVVASDDRSRWQVFGDSVRRICIAVLAEAGIELSRDGLAQHLARRVGLPHWQDDAVWGKVGHEALKAKISSEMGRAVRTGQVLVRTVLTGRRGEYRLMWRVPAMAADAAIPSLSPATGPGTGTGAGPGGMRPSSVSGRTPSHE